MADQNDGKRPYEVGCRMCPKTFVLNIHPDDVTKWQGGMLIQNAMPYLDADQRELLISGTCGDCWTKLFGEEPEAEIPENLEELVHRALDNAVQNGFKDFLKTATLEQICTDLGDNDSELEGLDTDTLGPHVMTWLKKNLDGGMYTIHEEKN